MDKEQQEKFDAWAHKEKFFKRFDGFSPTLTDLVMTAKKTWQACLDANKAEEQEPEPTPTEMVRKLLEKGWTVAENTTNICFRSPDKIYTTVLASLAYKRAFPRKKKIEVKAWVCGHCMRTHWSNDFICHAGSPMIEGTATFWV